MWFRRDLRLADHPALTLAASGGRPVLGLFVLDPALFRRAPRRVAFMKACVAVLDESIGGALQGNVEITVDAKLVS